MQRRPIKDKRRAGFRNQGVLLVSWKSLTSVCLFLIQILFSQISLKCSWTQVPASQEIIPWHKALAILTPTQHTQPEDLRETLALSPLITNRPHLRKLCASLDENLRPQNQQETLQVLGRPDTQAADQGTRPPMSPQIPATGSCGILLKGLHPLPLESGKYNCCWV